MFVAMSLIIANTETALMSFNRRMDKPVVTYSYHEMLYSKENE